MAARGSFDGRGPEGGAVGELEICCSIPPGGGELYPLSDLFTGAGGTAPVGGFRKSGALAAAGNCRLGLDVASLALGLRAP
jgi:hypothetical protein